MEVVYYRATIVISILEMTSHTWSEQFLGTRTTNDDYRRRKDEK
jgi:hypothetical protein